jgi:hypothetical protein
MYPAFSCSTPPGFRLPSLFLAFVLAAGPAPLLADWTFGGHSKLQLLYIDYPGNSIFKEVIGSNAIDNNFETRIKLASREDRWDFNLDYQFIGLHGDTLKLINTLPGTSLPGNNVISDDRRWWDLTYSFGDEEKTVFIHRLDRLSIGYTTEHTAWRFGRQAISWGNGLVFTPMDVFAWYLPPWMYSTRSTRPQWTRNTNPVTTCSTASTCSITAATSRGLP